jgi:hypothetical protein
MKNISTLKTCVSIYRYRLILINGDFNYYFTTVFIKFELHHLKLQNQTKYIFYHKIINWEVIYNYYFIT